MAASEPREPRGWSSSAGPVEAVRGEIHDRNGRLLAANLPVHSLYARPAEMVDPVAAAEGLARIFPGEDEKALLRRFTDGRKFLWVRRTITPSQRLAVHNLGEPGLRFGPRDARIYPKGRLASHILGGAAYGDGIVDVYSVTQSPCACPSTSAPRPPSPKCCRTRSIAITPKAPPGC